ncbi:hypothetical protein C0989_011881 [Termitomyces sp. Mn162]|nr:hypothetical protein C0989_011881 [Termitomyces sp. Mn162]
MEQMLAVQLAIPDRLKPRRSDLSKTITPYAGSAKFSELENWLMSICVFYTVAQYGGDGHKCKKVLILMDFLAVGALKQYLQYVIHVNRAQFHWRFEDVVLELYDQFVQPSKMQDAHNVFHDVVDANDEQEEEPAEANKDNAAEFKGTQENVEEYVELEMYKNDYYTWGSDSEGLFVLTEVPTAKYE